MRSYSKTAVLCTAFACSAAMAQTWDETADGGGDAGEAGIGAAQVVSGSGPLTAITGVIAPGGEGADVYLIMICDEANFSASTIGGVPFDSQLFLFNADGTGQVHNDDFTGLDSKITSQGVFSNGIYALAITPFNSDPLDSSSTAVFGFSTWPGPDSQQRMANTTTPFVSWTGDPDSGAYRITLTGACFVPAPGAATLLGLGGLAAARRRR